MYNRLLSFYDLFACKGVRQIYVFLAYNVRLLKLNWFIPAVKIICNRNVLITVWFILSQAKALLNKFIMWNCNLNIFGDKCHRLEVNSGHSSIKRLSSLSPEGSEWFMYFSLIRSDICKMLLILLMRSSFVTKKRIGRFVCWSYMGSNVFCWFVVIIDTLAQASG